MFLSLCLRATMALRLGMLKCAAEGFFPFYHRMLKYECTVTPHKRGIRNGPKALKPIPVIIRCKSCGQVKLPHFYCCSGDRGKNGEQNK